MDAQAIIQLISTVGFPITMCGAMGWFVVDQTNKHREEVSKLNKQHEEELAKLDSCGLYDARTCLCGM